MVRGVDGAACVAVRYAARNRASIGVQWIGSSIAKSMTALQGIRYLKGPWALATARFFERLPQ